MKTTRSRALKKPMNPNSEVGRKMRKEIKEVVGQAMAAQFRTPDRELAAPPLSASFAFFGHSLSPFGMSRILTVALLALASLLQPAAGASADDGPAPGLKLIAEGFSAPSALGNRAEISPMMKMMEMAAGI